MKISLTAGLGARNESTIPGIAARAAELETRGFRGMWMPNAFGIDAMTALAVAGSKTGTLQLGTAVIPTFPRHPVVMAQQALTTQAACDGRFTLGIGLSHKVMMQDSLGLPFEHPAKHMAEYLAVLAPLLRRESVSFHGSLYNVEAALTVDAAPVPLLVAALGPAMLKLTGRLADGTITSWVGPKALASHVLPGISAAASDAGRAAPQVVVGLPIELTNDADGARQRMAQRVEFYNSLPSYRAMLDIEGAEHPAELALLGNESALTAQLDRLAEAGATEFQAQLIATEPGSAQRTFEFLASLV